MDRLTDMVKGKARDGNRFDMRRPFNHFDASNNGRISKRDFEDGLRKLDFDLTRNDVNELLEYFDEDQNGKYFQAKEIDASRIWKALVD